MEKSDISNKLFITRLKSDYLSIKYSDDMLSEHIQTSFGGCQSWFGNIKGGEIIKKQGCGLIAMSDFILYLAGRDSKYYPLPMKQISMKNPIKYSDYQDFVLAFNRNYVNLNQRLNYDVKIFNREILKIHTNSIDGKMAKIINKYFKDNGIDLKAKWGITDSSIYSDGNWFEKGIRTKRIKDMLRNDIPAIISVGPSLFGKMKGINCYEMKNDSDTISYKFTGQKIANHYFTVTAVIEDNDKKENGEFDSVIYEVSSWGKKYYIAESEIKRFSRYNSSLFTNVLYVKKHGC